MAYLYHMRTEQGDVSLSCKLGIGLTPEPDHAGTLILDLSL